VNLKKRTVSGTRDSASAEMGPPESRERENSGQRPKLGGRWRDSAVTITGMVKENGV
jgi:hypothetical protein